MDGFYASITSQPHAGGGPIPGGQQSALLLGPYPARWQAEVKVRVARLLARRVDPNAHLYAYGTCKISRPDGQPLPAGKLNEQEQHGYGLDSWRLEPGRKYRITYRTGKASADRESVMTYQGRPEGSFQHLFDARPLRGAVLLDPSWIITWELADPAAVHYTDRKAAPVSRPPDLDLLQEREETADGK
jgi:hypothetical protein